MFKLKPGNVFQKLNKMDKKQAYTWGAIVVVCFIALITLASFLGDAEDASFDGYSTRGYDLAQMPFVNDEAEEYLLSSKYPDMKNNGATMLYSQAEKEARQEADEQAAKEEEADTEVISVGAASSRGYSGRSYAGGRGGTGTPTQVGQLGSASMGHAGGSGVGGTFGAPRGDFSPYKSQEKGSEIQTQLKNADARRALSQFAQTSRAAAGLKDNKNANAKRALMGGSIRGSEAFTDSGVDLSKASGLELDTNAPVSSADLSNLDKAVSDASNQGKKDKEDFLNDLKPSFWEQLGQNLLNAGVQIGLNYAMDGFAQVQANNAGNNALKNLGEQPAESYMDNLQAKFPEAFKEGGSLYGADLKNMTLDNAYAKAYGYDSASATKPITKTYNSSKQDFLKSTPTGSDTYYSAWDKSYNNNFWATQGSSITQAFSGAVSGQTGSGGISVAPVRRGQSSSRSQGNSSCTGSQHWVCRGSGSSQVCQCE